jgi:hypothetical protein
MAINNVDVKSFEDASLPTTDTDLYTAPALTTTTILSTLFSNKSADVVNISAKIVRSGGSPTVYIVKDAPVPVGGSLEIIENKPIVLEAGDKITGAVTTGGASDVDVVGSIMEMT